MTTVVNIHHARCDVLIDRTTPFGNPFSHLDNTRAVYHAPTRIDSIRMFHSWILAPAQAQLLIRARTELKDRVLGCHCVPAHCHGHVYAEILDDVTPVIPQFSGQYRFLSNFYIEPDLTNVECEYQAAKVAPGCGVNPVIFKGVTPGQAKRLGRTVPLRSDWEKVKLQIMFELVAAKFTDHEMLREALLATGNAQLVEGNNWGDYFWGTSLTGVGENHLGKILMEVRGLL